jgi:uncharacterized protein (TIGR02444 family)
MDPAFAGMTIERAARSMTEIESKSPGSPFWRFSLRFYRQPGVADACIALQEGAAVDVNLLLFLLWQATLSRAFSEKDVAAVESKIAAWRDATVIPLRAVRRALKAPPALVESGRAEAFRTRIKAVELEAERLQQEAMYELAGPAPLGAPAATTEAAAKANVAAYEAMRGITFAAPAVTALLAAFAAMTRQEGERPGEMRDPK